MTLLAEYQRQMKQLQDELELWQFQGKKLVSEAQKKSSDARAQVLDKIAREERIRKEKLEILQFQVKQVENLPLGSEILYTTVESSVQLSIGDIWQEVVGGTEIVLKDGVVHEIRQGGA